MLRLFIILPARRSIEQALHVRGPLRPCELLHVLAECGVRETCIPAAPFFVTKALHQQSKLDVDQTCVYTSEYSKLDKQTVQSFTFTTHLLEHFILQQQMTHPFSGDVSC